MAGNLRGKVAIDTGSSRGIGKAIAVALAREGASVAINFSRDDASASQAAEEVSAAGSDCILVKADVTSPEGAASLVQTTASRFDRVLAPDVEPGRPRRFLLLEGPARGETGVPVAAALPAAGGRIHARMKAKEAGTWRCGW